MALKDLKGETDMNEIIIQLKANCNCDKRHEQVQGAMNESNTDIWPAQVILRRIMKSNDWGAI